MAPLRVAILTLLALAGPAVARAQVQRSGPEEYPSKHEISTHLGYQAGFGGHVGSGVSGLKLEVDYAYKFHPLVWFTVQVANDFGFGSADGPCAHTLLAYCYYGGWDFELMAGVKLKWKTPIPLVVEAPILLGVDAIYNRECNDDGAAVPVVKAGGGVKYFVTRKIGLGAKIDFAFGPGFHGGTATSGCGKPNGYTDFFGYFDFMVGAEFVLGG
jgi:hypothetical protein